MTLSRALNYYFTGTGLRTMDHLLIIYYFFVLIGGVVSLTTAVHTGLILRDRTVARYAAFFIIFSLSVFTKLVSFYLEANHVAVAYNAVLLVAAAGLVLDTAVVYSGMVFFNALFAVRAGRLVNLVSGLIFLAALVLFFTPLCLRIDFAAESMEILPPGRAVMWLYMIGFTYLVLVGLLNAGREKRRREKIFKVAMTAFAVVGYAEVVLGKLIEWAAAGQTPSWHFYYSSVPYFLWSVFSIFFFLKYYRNRPLNDDHFTVSPSFMEKYAITKREAEIINLVARGLSNQAIGQELFVSLATIKSHLNHVFEKTGVRGRMALLFLLRNTK